MPTLFEKMNLKDHREIVVLGAPESFEPVLGTLERVVVKRTTRQTDAVHFAIAFATKQDDVDRMTAELVARSEGDAILWFAYPKKTSRNYACEFNRDTGWQKLHDAGFDTVRAVAIDDDWTALRFRRVEYIKRPVASKR
ncbi:hypothetical protein BH10PSE17_BH10PSE17_19090 [soil metagenome]